MNFIKQFLEKKRERNIEQKVLRRYQELAGALGSNGEMINRDKESRARAWVKEQEKLQLQPEPFWNSRTIQAAFIGGGFVILATLITLYLSK
ncbi:hypothetical protein A2W54_00195 [Candidatus Giovannonibacteria bacterium RIFCSPHIGHO2_02_43_13]|uniref:Uncharacterized protein n=1 Tax=Candidatus Giovannonibacteria bacterium RIFCSPHIGHO2_02_43_13 TaxID=1798330 RepID=A0A1F5WPP0_9BACT|nr:MAG: hypothetical protein UW28_C0005G0029 [Parcubacteria group bacterium GW2011_GWA2_44_13]OGF72384.1 MAG: hypothetical protein A3E06_02540 [Candidatus Giovannonibacteria bacterium RIFCSPHIGHO2_12_FULL_44_42]OGF77619.1 MAG: hypothetical protein A2W54_00195 [Candidatus Giovannonibacteria bacterium RIFCSPHIGHO2_02_43_13]OGF89205.1 MAG: hypothetical protein A3I94_00650 [Candidatus Giovannonibacteria bacterium RIFCSPLOWO2_02_FULL_43_54]OGF97026.1 MAG: hypothetical protein A3H08_03840 [Candidatus